MKGSNILLRLDTVLRWKLISSFFPRYFHEPHIPAGILWVSQDSSGLRLLLQNIAPFHICRGLGSKSYDHLIHAYIFVRPFVQELKIFRHWQMWEVGKMGPSAVSGDKGVLWQALSPHSSGRSHEVSVAVGPAEGWRAGALSYAFQFSLLIYCRIKNGQSIDFYHLLSRGLWFHRCT